MRHTEVVRRSHLQRGLALLSLATTLSTAAMAAQAPTASTTDPRVGLRYGMADAGSAIKNLELVSHRPKADIFDGPGGSRGLTYANSDMAFRGNLLYQGNFSGFSIWDISNPARPFLRKAVLCATGQGDPSIYGNLLFVSSEGGGDRLDCGTQGVKDMKDKMVGVRIYDVSDPDHPRKVADVQTCRGSHTHTLVPDPKDKGIVYVYVSGSAPVRGAADMPGCLSAPIDSANTARFRIDIIRVPLAHPEQAKIVAGARIFNDLTAARGHAEIPRPGAPPAAPRPPAPAGGVGPDQCHDITVYPAVGLAGGACGGYGLLLDISDPVNPRRIDFAGDTNFAYWHSATFNNEGTKVVFTDEWGGGTSPRCRITDPLDWGADAVFTIKDRKLVQGSYFKMPAAQTEQENCVAHNGSLIPVPGRDIMVQGWYQGGLNVFDFTNPNHVVEIAYFDRGPVPNHPERADSASTAIVTAGFWAAYWYNGHIYGSEIARGVDIFDLTPSEWLSQNEIDAAKLVKWEQFNPQMQPKVIWPAAFPVARSYLDQLVRGDGLAAARTTEIARDLNAAERMSGASRAAALTKLAAALDKDAAGAADAPRVRWLAAAVRDLAKASTK